MMGTIADKLGRLSETKELLKQRLTEKGVDVSNENVFYNLADKVGSVATGPEKTVLSINCSPWSGYVSAYGVLGYLSTANFTTEYIDCYIGEQLLVIGTTIEPIQDCELVETIYNGTIYDNIPFGYSKLLKITGDNPEVNIAFSD